MDAPENIGFAIAGWYYGEDDFGKSLCLAVRCGEDTDCTAASLGALMGILAGEKGLPKKWLEPLGDKIATLCIDKTSGGVWVPETVTQLTERVLQAVPRFQEPERCDLFAAEGFDLWVDEKDALFCKEEEAYLPQINGNGLDKRLPIPKLLSLSPNTRKWEHPLFTLLLECQNGPFYRQGQVKKIVVTAMDNGTMRQQQWLTLRLIAPETAEVLGGREFELPLNYNHGSQAQATFEILADDDAPARLELIVEVSLVGRHSCLLEKVVLKKMP